MMSHLKRRSTKSPHDPKKTLPQGQCAMSEWEFYVRGRPQPAYGKDNHGIRASAIPHADREKKPRQRRGFLFKTTSSSFVGSGCRINHAGAVVIGGGQNIDDFRLLAIVLFRIQAHHADQDFIRRKPDQGDTLGVAAQL